MASSSRSFFSALVRFSCWERLSDAVTAIPDGWWVVPAPIPAAALPGVTVRLISVDDGFAVDGIVAASGVDTGFGDEAIGAVAVPEEAAVRVSLAASSNRLVVLVAP